MLKQSKESLFAYTSTFCSIRINSIKKHAVGNLFAYFNIHFSPNRTLTQHQLFLVSPSVQFSSVAHSCPTLCDPMNCSMPGLPVYHQLLEFTQTHVRRVGDAIQPSHPLPSPSPLPSIFPSLRVFSNETALCIRWPKYWSFSFNISPSSDYSGLISFSMDWLNLLAVQGTLKSLLHTTVQKHHFFSAQLSL